MTRTRWALTVILVLAFARVVYWTEPFGISVDESTYLSLAEIPQSGGTLYLHAADRKPPGLLWIYQAVGELFGPWNIHAVHAVFLILMFCLCVLVVMIARRWGASSHDAALAGVLFAIFSSCFPREIMSANAEVPMILFLGLAFVFFDPGKSVTSKDLLKVFAVGIFGAAAVLCKQYAIVILLLAFVGAYGPRAMNGVPAFFARTGVCLLGGLLVFSAVYYYFYRRQAQDAFMFYLVWSGLKYVAESRTLANQATSGIVASVGMLAAWGPLWIASFVRLKNEPLKRPVLTAALLSAGALVTIYLSGRYYTHYFLPLVWGLSLLGGVYWRQAFGSRGQQLWMSGWAALSFGLFFVLNTYRDEVGLRATFTKTRQAELVEVAEKVRELTFPTDRIVVWGMASQIYPLSERGSGTRFVFADFVSGRQPGLASQVSRPQPGAQAEFLYDLYRAQPKVIVDTSTANLNDYGAFGFERFPELERVVTRNYFRGPVIKGYQLWIRSPH